MISKTRNCFFTGPVLEWGACIVQHLIPPILFECIKLYMSCKSILCKLCIKVEYFYSANTTEICTYTKLNKITIYRLSQKKYDAIVNRSKS